MSVYSPTLRHRHDEAQSAMMTAATMMTMMVMVTMKIEILRHPAMVPTSSVDTG
jgi:hypothetical protein